MDVASVKEVFKGSLPEDLDFGALTAESLCDALGCPYPLRRPRKAVGTFLRIVTTNDVYSLRNYPHVAAAIALAKACAKAQDCVALSFNNGDFLSPCVLTSLDSGVGMTKALDKTGFDYACLGNHEFDLPFGALSKKLGSLRRTKVVNSNVATSPLDQLPKREVVRVGGRAVLIGGFLGEDRTIYAPNNTPEIGGLLDSTRQVWDDATTELGAEPDMFLPMTHQLVRLDLKYASELARAVPHIAERTPVILGGHDHETYLDEAGLSLVVKTGMDAERFAIVDVYWEADGTRRVVPMLLPSRAYPRLSSTALFCESMGRFLQSVMEEEIARLPCAMSSKRVRFEESDLATWLLTLVRRGQEKHAVDLVLLQGGAVRAGAEYEAGPFTLGNLYAELAFECPQAVIELPGHVIQESVKNSRETPKPAPNFLHADDGVKFGEGNLIAEIAGLPFDAQRLYRVSIYQLLLTGLNVIEPLYSYVVQNVRVPAEETCTPVKDLVADVCMQDLWFTLAGLDCKVPHQELVERAGAAFTALDTDHDDMIKISELQGCFFAKFGKLPGDALLHRMIEALDEDGNGVITKDEFVALAKHHHHN